jgi:hypothetical protein
VILLISAMNLFYQPEEELMLGEANPQQGASAK